MAPTIVRIVTLFLNIIAAVAVWVAAEVQLSTKIPTVSVLSL